MNQGQLTKWVRVLVSASAVLCLYGSAKLSVAGIGLGGDLWWMNWVLAASFTLSQFVVNGSYEKELNWTILLVGFGSYTASIWMNILGIYEYQDGVRADWAYVMENFEIGIFLLGMFIDVFPEMALRWAMGESRVGDLFGNLIKTAQHPEKLTHQFATTSVSYGSQKVTPRRNSGNRRQELESQYRNSQVDEDDEEDVPQFVQNRMKHERRANT